MPPRRRALGIAAAVATLAVAVAVMLPWRAHLDIAVVALVLVVPVVLAVVVGGFEAGVVAVVLGFLLYDLLFIRPYGTLTVGRPENWTPLAVYVIVMLLVSRVVGRVGRAEAESRASERATAHLFELSEILVADRPPEQLFSVIVRSVRESFDLAAVALLLPSLPGDPSSPLVVAAQDGRALTASELSRIVPAAGELATMRVDAVGDGTGDDEIETVVLQSSANTVGLLRVVGRFPRGFRRDLLVVYANHVALALERSALREQVLRVRLLEEVDRHRRSLFGAVSHDLRTPLATIKASVTALRDPDLPLSAGDRAELVGLIENRADRLDRVVANLMDMSRIESGALLLDEHFVSVGELLAATLDAVGEPAGRVTSSSELGDLELRVDRTLIVEALANLVENALRHADPDSVVELSAAIGGDGGSVEISVCDRGEPFPEGVRQWLLREDADLGPPSRRPASDRGGTGLGLAIARAFVEAHGGTLVLGDPPPPQPAPSETAPAGVQSVCVMVHLPASDAAGAAS